MAVVPPVGAMIAIARRRVADHLIDVGATSADKAVTYQPTMRLRRKGLRYLQRNEVVHLTQDGRYWINEGRYREYRASMRKRMGVILGGAAAAAAAIFAFTR